MVQFLSLPNVVSLLLALYCVFAPIHFQVPLELKWTTEKNECKSKLDKLEGLSGVRIRMITVDPLQRWRPEMLLIYTKKTDINNLEKHLPTILLLCFEELSQDWKTLS